jgi:hypothetical protein
MTPYADWPDWLRVLVLGPHALLLLVALLRWSTTNEGKRNLLFLGLYLAAFLAVMHFVFGFHRASW